LRNEEDTSREAVIKNLSLRLLEVDTATEVLDLFESHCITGRSSGAASNPLQVEAADQPEILIENLIMMLLFFKTKLQDMPRS